MTRWIPAAAALVLAAGWPQAPPADYPIRAVPLADVRITGGFWHERLETNRTVTIPHILRQNETTGRVNNLRKGAGVMTGAYEGRRFNDTDVYKIIEAASYSLATHPDPALASALDDLITLIEASQEPDGYLFPARTIDPAKPAAGVGTERWQYENTGSHELYNAGHLYEAAVAHAAATGSTRLLDVARRNADLVRATFGPDARRDAPGHEVIELALARLFRATSDRRYLALAKFFLDERGTDHHASLDYTEPSWQLYNDRAYRQDDRPLVDQTRGQGHAVRGVYAYAAMTDVAVLFGDAAYDRAVTRIWDDVLSKRVYLTGGLGSVGGTEAFGPDYVLPSRSAYAETCAAVGGVLWYHRMFLKSGDARYLDAFEQTLYNGLLSGVSIAGDTFFYQNPLESTGRAQRSAYFDVACCPANLSRLVAQLPGLVYATRGSDLFVNLYVESDADVDLGGARVRIRQRTGYPWQGRVEIALTADRPVDVTLRLRVPGWLGDGPFGTDLYRFEPDETAVRYGSGGRTQTGAGERWIPLRVTVPAGVEGATAFIDLPMPVRRLHAHPGLADASGKIALQRGPLVYAFEGLDNGGRALDLRLPPSVAFTPAYDAALLGGVTVLRAAVPSAEGPPRAVVAVPYFAWANRGRGEMAVWIPAPPNATRSASQ